MEETKQFTPDLGKKVDRRYKWRYLLYKKIAIALGVMLLGAAYLLVMSLRGNLNLAKQLQESKTPIILPSGKVLTGK